MDIQAWRFPTAIRFGAGARARLAELRDRFGATRPLLVTDEGLRASAAFRLIEATMNEVWPDGWHVHAGVHSNPIEADVEDGFAAYREHGCDSVVAVGGGSPMDAAKAIVLRVGHPDQALVDIALGAALPDRIVPLAAIPTTAGTGSEVGQSAVVTIPALGRKVMFWGPPLLPQIAILDPELTVTLPPHLTAATGMDAMTHAIESFVCPVFHPMCDGIALEAIHRIRTWLPRAVEQGDDLEARGQMLVAASMGAVAFQKDLGAAHSMAHPLGTEAGVHHGLANAVVLPATIRFNGEVDSQQYARVAQALGIAPGADPAAQVADAIEALNRRIGLPTRLRDAGVTEADLERLPALAVQDACHQTNPRACSEADFARLYREAW